MKKTLLALAVASFATMGANAAKVYFDNTGTGWESVYGYSWNPSYDEELSTVTIDGHELYVAELDNEEIIFRSTNASWSDDAQTANLAVVDGAVYGQANIKVNGGSTKAQANIVNGQYVPVEIVPSEYPEMYLVGAVSGWGVSDKYEMTTTNGKTYTLTCEIEANSEFKFFGGTWGLRELTYSEKKLADGTYTFAPGNGNTSLATGGTVTFTLVANDDFSSAEVTIAGQSGGGGGDDPVDPTLPEELYLTGTAFGGWNANDVKMVKDGDAFTYTATDGIDGEWKITDGTWAFSLGQGEEGMPELNTEYTLSTDNAGNLESKFTGEVTIKVYYSNNNWYLLLSGENQGGGDDPIEPTVPETLYLMGNWNATGWAPDNGLEMTREGNVYTCKTGIVDAGEGYGYFSFATVTGAEWGDLNGGDRFGPAAPDTDIAANETDDITLYAVNVNASSCPSWKIAASAEGKAYVFTVDFDNNTLSVKETTGVASIEATAGEAVYFNLQGIRVNNPENGVFVRVLNGKAEKVVK